LRHAAGCDHCGPLLRESLADFADDVTTEEEAFVAGLESSSRQGQERTAARLASSGHTSIPAWLRQHLSIGRPVFAWASAAAAVAMIAGIVLILNQPRPIEDLLASAYTEQRTLELRIPQAAYGPLRLVRGSTARSRLDRPPALLEGEARIARELARNANDPRWLQARGRAELLDRDFDTAIADLQRAVALLPDSPVPMTDLASALYERAEANTSQADYSAAIELLNRVLRRTPDDPVSLFNRAIIHQRMHSYDNSIADWQHYLRVDPRSPWTDEARQRLADVEQAKKK
jgi:tetratricopeptide (TPR) repeat protein